LHHRSPLGEPFRSVVRRTHFVSLRVRELKFDQVGIPALFIE
jgi:hypothetical protein